MTKYSLTMSDLCAAPASKFSRFNKTALSVIVASCVLGALFVYLAQVNAIASKGFALRDLENQIQNLQLENEKLAVKIIELKSMNELNGRIAELGMVPVGKVSYYNDSVQVVARR